jgi:hypothetical protein
MRAFNDAQRRFDAKSARAQQLFHMKTALQRSPVVLFGLVLLGLSASIPAALLFQEEERVELPAYLEIDVSGQPGSLASYQRR